MCTLSEILIALAFLFVILELLSLTGGLLATAGVIMFIVGAVILYSVSVVLPFVFLYVILPVFLALTLIVVVILILGYRAHKRKVLMGSMVGKKGVCVKPIRGGKYGQVDIEGELWRASSVYNINKGDYIVVVKQDSLRLEVEPVKKERG